MAKPRALFPDSLWDGSTKNPDRLDDFQALSDPDAYDFDRIAVEIIAIQEYLFAQPLSVVVTETAVLTPTFRETIYLIDATGGDITITLPDPTEQRHPLNFKRITAPNMVVVQQFDTDLIDGDASKTIASQWTNLRIAPFGGNWYIL